MNIPRTKRRASSRAHTPCPHCHKLLHGARGLKMHIDQEHKPKEPGNV